MHLPDISALPSSPRTAAEGAQKQESATNLKWDQVWLHALIDVEVVVVARMALDDANAAVVAAAADLVLCILAGSDGGEEGVFEAADAHPYTGVH